MKAALFELLRAFYRRCGGRGLGLGLHDRLQPFIQRWLQPERVELEGFHLYLDAEDRTVSYMLAVHREWEAQESRVFKQILRPGMQVLDVGAHIGYFTLMASTLVGPRGRVYAFEPEPSNRALLEKNVRSNGRKNVFIVPKAASDAAGASRLHLNASNKGAHFLFAAPGEAGPSVEVETVALGPWLRENEVTPSFIKMDVEGGEWRALDGMKEALTALSPLTILFEFFPEALRRAGSEPREWLDRLAVLGFDLRYIDESGRELRSVGVDEVLALPERSCNLLASRGF